MRQRHFLKTRDRNALSGLCEMTLLYMILDAKVAASRSVALGARGLIGDRLRPQINTGTNNGL